MILFYLFLAAKNLLYMALLLFIRLQIKYLTVPQLTVSVNSNFDNLMRNNDLGSTEISH